MPRPLVPMKRPPGRPPRHGARALARAIEQKKLDRRTRPARLRQRAANLIAEDAGGWPNLNNRESMLVWATASTWVLLAVRFDALLAGKATEEEGSLKWLVALQNSFRRNLEVLGVRPEPLERELTLTEYLAAKAASNGDADGNADLEADARADDVDAHNGDESDVDGPLETNGPDARERGDGGDA